MAKNDKPAETKTYTVKSPLKHSGESFADGDTIDLTAAEAESLVAAGVIAAPKEPAKAKAEAKAPA